MMRHSGVSSRCCASRASRSRSYVLQQSRRLSMSLGDSQMDIDACLIEAYRRKAKDSEGHPYMGDFDWPAAILDLIRMVEALQKEKEELRQAVIRKVE